MISRDPGGLFRLWVQGSHRSLHERNQSHSFAGKANPLKDPASMPIKATMCKQARKYSSAGVSVGRSFYYLFPQNHRLPEAPKVGQHVSIEGQPGVYVVLRLDKKRFAADLMLTTGNHAIEHNVPYFAIEAVRSNGEAEAPVKYATG